MARPPARVLDGAPKVGGFPASGLQEYPVGCWLGMLNIGVTCEDGA